LILKTEILKFDPKNPKAVGIRKAAQVLKDGGLVAFPTETVYGLGADLLNTSALSRLYDIKKRPKDKPFTVAIADLRQLAALDCEVSPYTFRFMSRFWPGPLTIILWTKKEEKLGIRMPDDNIALSLLKELSIPVALPSANISGNPAPTTAEQVLKDLGGKIEMILDGGRTRIGIESTVLDLTISPYHVLREGAIKGEEFKKVPKKSVLFVCTGNSCRSMMAEGLFKHLLKERGRNDVEVISAGIIGLNGSPPTGETIQVMDEAGVNVRDFKTKGINTDFINRADLILGMQEVHKREILALVPQAEKRVHLLREFTKDEVTNDGFASEVPDPISKPSEVYKRVFEIIKRNLEKLVDMI